MANETDPAPPPSPPNRARTEQGDGFGGFSDQPAPESETPEQKDE